MRTAVVHSVCLVFAFLFASSLQAQTVLQFPRVISNDGTYTGIAVGNPTTAEVSVTFTAFQSDGSILSGAGVRNPITVKIPAGGQAAKLFPEIFGAATFDGWVQATSSSTGLTGFFLNGNTALTDLDGAGVDQPTAEFIFPFVAQDAITKTELTIVNVNSEATTANVTLYARDGQTLGTKDLALAANGLVRQDIETLFPDADLSAVSHAKVRAPRQLIGHEVVSNYQITATAPRRESIALTALQATSESTYVLPQFASGNGWMSVIGIVNAAGIGQEITVSAYKEDGTLWPTPSNPKRISLDANEGFRTTVDELFGFSSDTNAVGWIKIESTLGNVASYIGYGNTLTPSFALVRGTDTTRAARYEVFSHVAEGSGFYSGLTVVNPGTTDASVEFYTLRADGTTVGRSAFTVGPSQRIGKLFSEFVPSTLDQLGGWAFLRSSQPVIAAVLFGTSSGSALASVPQQLPAGDFLPAAQTTGAISGTVRSSNSPIAALAAGVQISLTGPVVTTRTTDATGRYNFPQLPNGDYKVTANLPGFVFTPAQRSVTINRQNADAVDFDASGLAPTGTPVIQLITPASAFAGSSTMSIRIFGTDFAPSSVVRLNGIVLQSTFVSSGELEALVPASLLAVTGTLGLIVETPPPGGGASNRVDFTINAAVSNSLIIGRATVGSFPAGVALDRVRGTALVTNQSSDTVSVVDLNTFQSKASIPVGRSPAEGIAIHPGLNLALVANPGSDNISVIDLTKNQEVKKITVGRFPVGLAINPNTNRAIVTNAEDDTASIVDLSSLAVITQIPVGTLPASVAINTRTNEAVVANRGANTVSIIDLNTNSVASTVRVGQAPRGVAISSLTNVAVVANANSNDATVIDLKSRTVLFTAIVGTAPTGVAIHEFADTALITNSGVVNGSKDFGAAGTVSVLAIGTREITATIPVGSAPFGVDVDQQNQTAVIANFGSNDVTGLHIPNPRPRIDDVQPKTFPPGGFVTFTITGADFVPGAVVLINAQPLPTTYVSPSQLKAELSGALADSLLLISGISSIGTKGGVFAAVTTLQFNVIVSNPPPGGGNSPSDPSITRIFPQNGVPVLVSLSPTESNVGASLTLTLNGTNFNGTSIINFGANSYSPQSVSHSGMSVTIPANEISAGTKTVSVTNPAPGGGSSQTLSFTVNNSSNPPPVVTAVNPAELAVGSGAATVTVTGTGFSSSTTATLAGVNGSVNGNTITFNLTAALTNNGGTLQGLITNPPPGGGTAEFNVNVTSGPPTITGFTPNSVAAGTGDTVIQVSGTNFLASTQITIEGTPIPTTWISATQLTGTIPAGFLRRSGNDQIGVTTPSPGGGASAIGTFQIVAPRPVLQSVTPARGPIQTADLAITLGGSGFAGNSIAFIGAQRLATVYTSPGALSATIPGVLLGNAGVLQIVVSTAAPGGGTSGSVPFTVENPAPVVTSVTPQKVRADQVGAVITVAGSGFVKGASIGVGTRSLVTTFVSATQLTGVLAVPMPLGGQSVTVTNPGPGGGTSNTVDFEVTSLQPTITSVIPSTAVPGQTIRIIGTNFGQGSVVLLRGVPITTTTVSDTELTAVIPPTAAPGPADIIVRNPAGFTSPALDSQVVTIQFVNPTPVLTSVAPTSGNINSTITIHVTGSNFISGAVVTFDGNNLQTTFINSTTLDASVTLPAVPGKSTLRVVNPGNASSNTLSFDVTAPVPSLSQVSPNIANANTIVGVTLNGSDFVPGGTTVSITGTGVTVSDVNVISSSSLTATFTISANAPLGRRDITVTTVGGTSGPVTFIVNPPAPTLTVSNPSSAIQGQTLTVTLNGTSFLAGTTVAITGAGNSAGAVNLLSSTTLTVPIAAGTTPGTYSVSVTTAGGTSNTLSFTINADTIGPVTQLASRHFAGSFGGFGTEDNVGTLARFYQPEGIWGDGTYLYIVDSNAPTIRKMNIATGVVTTFAGLAGGGPPADGVGTAARFLTPYGIWGDGTNLYVTDQFDYTIRKIVLATGAVTTFAGLSQTPGNTDGSGSSARFTNPTGIWGDGTNLYVLDDSSIRKVIIASGDVSTFAGTIGSPGSADGPGSQAQFSSPKGIWGDAANLYVADSGNHTIRKVVISGPTVSTIAGSPGTAGYIDDPAGLKAQFTNPSGVWSDGTNLYVTDTGNVKLRKIVIASTAVTTVTDLGTGASSFTDESDSPTSIWGDGTSLYISDGRNFVIQKVVIATGVPTIFTGSFSETGFSNGTGSVARFNNPTGMWGDTANLYVADASTFTIRQVVRATGAVTTLAGTPLKQGSADGVGSAALFYGPHSIWGDGTNLYVTDNFAHTIRKIVIATGAVTTIAGSPQQTGTADGTGSAARFTYPAGIWGDGTNLYVADSANFTIRKIVIATGAVTTFAGAPGTAGTTDGPGIQALFEGPIGLWGNGDTLFVADSNGYTIRTITISTGVVSTLAGLPLQSGFADGTGTAAQFANPQGLWSDGTNIYLADMYNNAIRKIKVSNGAVTTLLGNPNSFAADDGADTAARIPSPRSIWGDGSALYVTDTYSIRKITPLATPGLSSINPPAGSQGTTIAVTLQGSDFAPGSTISVSGTGVTARPINPTGLGTIEANFIIAPAATLGGHNVTVTTSAGTSTSVTFTVGP